MAWFDNMTSTHDMESQHLRKTSLPAKAFASASSFLERTYWSVAETLPHDLEIQPDEYGKTLDTRSQRQALMNSRLGICVQLFCFVSFSRFV